MHLPQTAAQQARARAIALMESASPSPEVVCEENPEIREAFDHGLRQLAEDIVKFHPDLAHLLIGLGQVPGLEINGRN